MIFSKSFGYALRGVLYVAVKSENGPVSLDEISEALGLPRHFMGKIMKRLVQQNILESQKGPSGGFLLNDATLGRFLVDVYKVTDHPEELSRCVLARGECSEENPCRLHPLIAPMKGPMFKILYETRVIDLLDGDNQELLNGLTVNYITG